MDRYYFYIKFTPQNANAKLLIGRCLFIFHGFIKKKSLGNIGVSFPEWSDDNIGSSIAFVGEDAEVLSKLQKQNYFRDMFECGFFEIGNIVKVPEDCPEVRFKRNQLIKKTHPSEIKRRMKRLKVRAEAQGRRFEPQKLTHEREINHYHLVNLQSKSTKVDVVLYIQKEENSIKEFKSSDYNSYGLATNEKYQGTVPDIKLK